jgi:hypothetical protein
MIKLIKNFLDLLVAWVIILPGFYLLLAVSWAHIRITECYYKVFRIPYYKMPDKFGYYVVRAKK